MEKQEKQRRVLAENKKTPDAKKGIYDYQTGILDESYIHQVIATVNKEPVVIVGMAQNPYVKKARKALDEAKIEYKYLEYGSYFSQWDKRLVIKMWTGWPTFPQVFVNGTLIGGFDDTTKALKDGSFESLLSSGSSSPAQEKEKEKEKSTSSDSSSSTAVALED